MLRRVWSKPSAVGRPLSATIGAFAALTTAVVVDASAQSFTIVNGQTVNVQQTLGPGGIGIIEEGGAINVVGVPAILGTDNATVDNAGNVTGLFGIFADNNNSINTSGAIIGLADGISVLDNNTIYNSGSISGVFNNGVEVTDNNIITNNGSIDGFDAGIDGFDNNTVTNNGSITALGVGIDLRDNNVVNNSGSIAASFLDGISAFDNNTIVNSGFITATFENGIIVESGNYVLNNGTIVAGDDGIDGEGINNTVINFGFITSTADDGVEIVNNSRLFNAGSIVGFEAGVEVEGSGNRITNDGTIANSTGPSGLAIDFQGTGSDTLVIQDRSIIIGRIRYSGDGGADDVAMFDLDGGFSKIVTFSPRPDRLVFNTNGIPFAVNGNTVAVLDPTNLAAQDEFITDLLGGINRSVFGRLDGLRNGTPPPFTAFAPAVLPDALGFGMEGGPPPAGISPREYWADAFGSVRDQDGESPTIDAEHRLGGFVSGMEVARSAFARTGLFFGGSWGSIETDIDSQTTNTESVYGGLYASTRIGPIDLDAVLTAGHTDYERERRVANNLVSGGFQTAKAEYDGWFVSPTLGMTAPSSVMGRRVEGRLETGYTGLFLDGFTESGASDGLRVDSRGLHLVHGRASLALPFEQRNADGSLGRVTFEGGVNGRVQFGDEDVSATLLGQSIVFDPGGDQSVGGVFAGFRGEVMGTDGTSLYVAVEGNVESDGSEQVFGRIGLDIPL